MSTPENKAVPPGQIESVPFNNNPIEVFDGFWIEIMKRGGSDLLPKDEATLDVIKGMLQSAFFTGMDYSQSLSPRGVRNFLDLVSKTLIGMDEPV